MFYASLIVVEKIMSDVASYTGLRHSNEMLDCSRDETPAGVHFRSC